jgi:hypothetical protein
MIAKRLIRIMVVGAVVLLTGCGGNKARMLQQLEQLEQQNHSGQPMLNDSLAEDLVSYFDRHGSANERMRSRYILGRTYYCLGELPRALELYNEAADCADTTAAECEFKVLSRIYAQKAVIFHKQVQPQSQLKNLKKAEFYARIGKDTLQAIECYAQQADAYDYLHEDDSVIYVRERSAQLFLKIDRKDRAAQTLGSAIINLIEKHDYNKAKLFSEIYESNSNLFDETGNINSGREIYYYLKGMYYLAVHQLDSAEYMFRKELRDGKDMNNQIAGNKGLQLVYEQRRIPDSIAKYAKLSYELNDSAYSLSEMQNLQKFQASYNYNHKKELAEKESRKAQAAFLGAVIVACLLVITIMVCLYYIITKRQTKEKYIQKATALERAQSDLLELRQENVNASSLIERRDKELQELQAEMAKVKKQSERKAATLESRLDQAPITIRMRGLLEQNPVQSATTDDFRQLRMLINEEIPSFYKTLNTHNCSLRPIEYEVCLLLRCHFQPAEICKLTDRSDSYISNLRKAILKKCFNITGSPSDLDQRILAIK